MSGPDDRAGPRSERREHLDELLAAAVEAEIERGEREGIPEDEEGGIATWVVVLSVTALVVSIGGSIWFTFFR